MLNLWRRLSVLQFYANQKYINCTVKKIIPGLLLSTALILIIQSCGGSSKPSAFAKSHQKQASSVETSTISLKPISEQIHAYGTVESKGVVQVTPQISNRITHIYVEVGDTVSQGERLAKIYGATYKQQVAQARAQISQYKATFEQDSAQYVRQKKLYKRQLISATDLDQAKAAYLGSKSQLQSAYANLKQNQDNLDNTVIRSPVRGVVIARNVSVGDVASTGQAAFNIGNLTGYRMRVYLPRDEWKSAKLGQEAHFQLPGDEHSPAVGRVSHISPRLDPTTGLGEVIVSFTKKTQNISTGMLIQAIINVATHPKAIVIPRSALVENVQTVIQPESNIIQTKRNYSAFVVQGDSLALKHKLKLGIEQGNKVEILKGLQDGDKIVTTGQANLTDSSKVRVVNGKNLQNKPIPIGEGDMAKKGSTSTKNADPDTSSSANSGNK
jgi:RND family efflux transporter MFP subunit